MVVVTARPDSRRAKLACFVLPKQDCNILCLIFLPKMKNGIRVVTARPDSRRANLMTLLVY